MLQTYLRRVFVGACLSFLGGALATGMACSSSPRKIPGTQGAAGSSVTGNGSGTAGSTGTTGAAGSNTTGTAGSSTTGAAGSSTGAAGDTSGAGTAGTTGTAGSTTGTGGAAGGAAGTAGTAGTAGAAGTAVDNTLHITDAFPIAVTKYWYPSGWDGDAATKASFGTAMSAIKIENQTTPTAATTGPCSKRVTGAIGDCFKVTYAPVMSDAGATNASVALIPELPMSNMHNYADVTMAPHVPAGAMKITAEVAGDVGGEVVQFNLWTTNQGDLFMPTLAAQTWQKISSASAAAAVAPNDQELSPFGWGSMSTKTIVFYYDDIRIENTP
jgi:hypothetical protein